MCSTVRFVVVRRVLSMLRLGPKPDEKDIEIAVLRHTGPIERVDRLGGLIHEYRRAA